MKLFSQLIQSIDESHRTMDKIAAIQRYFTSVPAEDAAWAVFFLTGRKFQRAIKTPLLRQWAAEASGHPMWLMDECYENVGDLAETIHLFLPEPAPGRAEELSLHQWIEQYLLPLRRTSEAGKKVLILEAWARLGGWDRLVWNKMLTGGWRIGVSKSLVTRALAETFDVDPAIMAHRMLDQSDPSAGSFLNLALPESASQTNPARPYPFYLASPMDGPPDCLGPVHEWIAEWKWDGIRAQLIRRQHLTLLWSRGEEFMPDCFPEIEIASMNLPNGTVLDGELVAWDHDIGIPKPFGQLQTRLNRRSVSRKLLDSEPVIFIAYDLLEDNSMDLREHPLHIRRSRLQHLLDHHMKCDQIQISPEIKTESWDELMCIRDTSRERKVEGLMLKNANSPYRTGRIKGDWFKWKLNPWTADMVLLYAQRGHGKRATLFSDYTFGVWDNGQLLTVAKAYSGLSNQEINQIDQWIKSNTIRRFGPVHEVPPHHVFEIAFEGIQHSARHKSGLALRFPRISRWRTDKKIHEADTLESLKAIIRL